MPSRGHLIRPSAQGTLFRIVTSQVLNITGMEVSQTLRAPVPIWPPSGVGLSQPDLPRSQAVPTAACPSTVHLQEELAPPLRPLRGSCRQQWDVLQPSCLKPGQTICLSFSSYVIVRSFHSTVTLFLPKPSNYTIELCCMETNCIFNPPNWTKAFFVCCETCRGDLSSPQRLLCTPLLSLLLYHL